MSARFYVYTEDDVFGSHIVVTNFKEYPVLHVLKLVALSLIFLLEEERERKRDSEKERDQTPLCY